MTKSRKAVAWADTLPSPPPDARLRAALFTSFRPVDASFLAGVVLPRLLAIPSADVAERVPFIAEAISALEPLRGKISVISSAPADWCEGAGDSWLWSYVGRYFVGRAADHVQHAKLWLWHCETDDGEQLQMTVSSTNLTADAFRNQIQGGVTLTLPLLDRGAVPERSTRALAPVRDLLRELGDSAGCTASTAEFIGLLERCECPPGIEFIASIPGRESPLPALSPHVKGRVSILSPFYGAWSEESVGAWCVALGLSPRDLDLVWPAEALGWAGLGEEARDAAWTMAPAVRDALVAAGVRWRSFDGLVGAERGDARWGHAKFYDLGRGLLVGSHNWSIAAWGLPGEEWPNKIRNFELSALVKGMTMDFVKPLRSLKPESIPVVEASDDGQEGSWLSWAHATWDGERLTVLARSADVLRALWHDGYSWREAAADDVSGKRQHRWTAAAAVESGAAEPSRVLIASSRDPGLKAEIAVVDTRHGDVLGLGLHAELRDYADEFLLASYGGPLARSAERIPRPRSGRTTQIDWGEGAGFSYRPEWLESARRWAAVVDNWVGRYPKPLTTYARAEARRLQSALRRVVDKDDNEVGAALAAEELAVLCGGEE